MSNRWAKAVRDPNFIPARTVARKSAEERKEEKKKEATPVVYDKYVSEKHFDEIRSMFHDLLFGKVALKANEKKLIEPWYHEFCRSNKLTPGQRSTLAAMWVKHKEVA